MAPLEEIKAAQHKQDLDYATRLYELHACVKIAEEQRQKILADPCDPSYTEHLAEVQTRIKARIADYFNAMSPDMKLIWRDNPPMP